MLTPAYGTRALADLLPSVLASLGVPGEVDALGLAPGRRTVLLLVDGLGTRLLEQHAALAPFLSSLVARPLTAGFPTTTATSLSSLGTGLAPGEHGVTGYTSRVQDRTLSWLGWDERGADLRDELVPEQLQPRTTAFERAERAGVSTTVAGLARFEGSGLTRAVLRGGTYRGVFTPGDTVARVAAAAADGERSLVYCYTPDLDLTGHVRGVDSDAWREQLRVVDAFAEQLLSRLPSGARLLVTGDHGMVDVGDDAQVDYDTCPDLQSGVTALAGEPRARHVHVEPGAQDDVAAAWRARLGERAHVLLREEAVEAGLLGPVVTDEARARTGDVVVVAAGELAVVRGTHEPWVARLRGHHGALTPEELDVPLLSAQA
ncbi:MAG: phosphodiesterase [Frankiales bacterium]|nr:phosphodiesterase [Frankiales bacterium]